MNDDVLYGAEDRTRGRPEVLAQRRMPFGERDPALLLSRGGRRRREIWGLLFPRSYTAGSRAWGNLLPCGAKHLCRSSRAEKPLQRREGHFVWGFCDPGRCQH